MTILGDLLSTVFERRAWRPMRGAQDGRPLEELVADLVGTAGEASGLALAGDILARFKGLDDAGKLAFFLHVARAHDIDASTVRAALDAYAEAPTRDSYRAFMATSEPRRQELIRRLNHLPGATGDLVRMRADLLRLMGDAPELAALDLDFRHLFGSWFNRGFLVLRPISWESPAHILEKIIAYEAVHAIDSWSDLRRRLEPEDRRCFAFFHPSMPDEPLIFVEVALTQGIPGSVQDLLAQDRTALSRDAADAAVFYSISNCQAGLAGISFGNSLIKQVAADLAADLPGLKTFVTLSPIPGLTRWLQTQGLEWDADDAEAMVQLAAWYLLEAKGRGDQPYDPVARFHLGNGALVHAVHAGADLSENGQRQSGGVMVNYLYDLDMATQNHEAFAKTGQVVAKPDLRTLAKAGAQRWAQTNAQET